jgi:hypothetical protein
MWSPSAQNHDFPKVTVKFDANQNNSGQIVENDTCGRMILFADWREHESYLPPVYIGLMPH